MEDKPDEITEDSGMNEETASEVQEAEPELANEPIILATLGDINQCDSSIGIMQNTKVVEDGAMRADLVDVLSSSPTLDELMDYAFQQKECQEFEQALKAFEQAFKLYPDCDGAPFLIIEIGTLQKNAGMFDEAITTFVEGRRIAAKLNNNIFEKEFIDAIAYLRIAKNILLEHKMYHTPYKEIPIPIMDEINKEFLEWRNIS
ncbi:hypothetical protein SDC9_06124 [bioreactor metagenome]|uniref:Tetratricopeptide repeat protein n=1 Tax=bioreactor metagenome TaxID=1076179 RepID=A0A644T0X4_9ZZZZ